MPWLCHEKKPRKSQCKIFPAQDLLVNKIAWIVSLQHFLISIPRPRLVEMENILYLFLTTKVVINFTLRLLTVMFNQNSLQISFLHEKKEYFLVGKKMNLSVGICTRDKIVFMLEALLTRMVILASIGNADFSLYYFWKKSWCTQPSKNWTKQSKSIPECI